MRTLAPKVPSPVLLSVLWAALLTVLPAHAITHDEARHLLERTGFAAEASAIGVLRPLSRAQAVEHILEGAVHQAATPPPSWVTQPPPDRRRMRDASEATRNTMRAQLRQQARELKAWWYREMLTTSHPLTERMTLFWHNHFPSSIRKVKWPGALYQQNLTLRRHALGNFSDLVHAIVRDPAMLIYLDNHRNKRTSPNENLARELLELFTLGEGNYAEADVKAAARALTGSAVDHRRGTYMFRKRIHDSGEKQFLGQQGNFDSTDIVNIILREPAVAALITRKLWAEFVAVPLDEGTLNILSTRFRQTGYQVTALLRALLNSGPFWAASTHGMRIKSPVELLVGTLRRFDIRIEQPSLLVSAGRSLGQDVFNPPNVKGWPGGSAWITADTLLKRRQILDRFLRSDALRTSVAMGGKPNKNSMRKGQAQGGISQWLAGLPTHYQAPETLTPLVLALAPAEPVNTSTRDLSQQVRQLVLDPVYQLK